MRQPIDSMIEAALPAEARAFLAALRIVQRERARLLVDTDGLVAQRLQSAGAAIISMLAGQPPDWAQTQLSAVQAQVQAIVEGMRTDVAGAVDDALLEAWRAGIAAIDTPFAAASIHVTHLLPVVDVSVLQALRVFTDGRIKDVSAEAAGRIDAALSLAALGATTPNQAMGTVRQVLGDDSAHSVRRARTIVLTELAQAHATAAHQRLDQTAAEVPGMQKQWRRSGKIHSRWNHDAADGQVVDADKPFVLREYKGAGTVEMMYPHDPKAPAAEVINCGCTFRPWLDRWGLPPGGTPFTDREKKLNPLKAGSGWLGGRFG